MLALGLCVALFVVWLVVGLAVLATVRPAGHPLETLLLAPAIGLAVVLLCVFLVSRGGVPLGVAALPLALLPLCAALGVLWRTRPSLPLAQYAPFGALLLLALLATGRPMLEFDLDWVSYSNDDMANYTLAAQRIVSHGFFDIPLANDLVKGQDYSLGYWFFNLGVRPGAEMLTAWTSGLTRLTPHQVFMPLIIALHLVLVSAASALALRGPRPRLAALATCFLLAISAMTTLGALYQLIGQVGGLSLLVACVIVLMRPFVGLDRAAIVRHGVLIALAGSALFVMYPEVVPFLGLSWLLFVGISLARRRERLLSLAPVLGVAVVLGALLLNTYSLISVAFLASQATAGMAHADLDTLLFPYFLVPSGLATFWGFQNLVALSDEPWLSVSVGAGGILLVLATVAAIRGSWRLQPSAVVALVMSALGLSLFLQRGDFGLFKLAMFIQPFLLPTIVVTWIGLARVRLVQVAPLVVLGLVGMYGQTGYVERSRGLLEGTGGGLTEIPNASGSRINTEFKRLLSSVSAQNIVLDTSNVVLAKFQALYLIGRASTFTTQDFFYNIANADPGLQLFNPNIAVAARELRAARNERFATLSFDLHDASQPFASNTFVATVVGQPPQTPPTDSTLIETSHKQTLLNRWTPTGTDPTTGDFVARPWNEVANHLLFISSALGQPYYTADRRHVALYQLEPDLFYAGETMGGMGRHFVFQVINPSPSVRLVLDLTATLAGDGINIVPPAAVIGTDRLPLPMVGRGSARVVSPPIEPQIIDGRAYVGIDMGTDGSTFPSIRQGLMSWFGTDVPFDRRRLAAFGRDISLISEEEYAHVSAPSSIDDMVTGLRNPHLSYSGVYEDGWISDNAYVELGDDASTRSLVVQGSMPASTGQDQPTRLQVLVDGREILNQQVAAGEFTLSAPVEPVAGRRHVELHFDHAIRLGAPDNRLASARLYAIRLATGPAEKQLDIVTSSTGVALGSGWYAFEAWAGQQFRWVNNDAEILLDRKSMACTLTANLEPGPGVGSEALVLQTFDSSGALLTSSEVRGRETLVLSHTGVSAVGDRVIRLHAAAGGQASPGDSRILNFRVYSLGCSEDEPLTASSLLPLNTDRDIVVPESRQALTRGDLPWDAVILGRGWYAPESAGGEQFRWVANDAELVVTGSPSSERQISLEIEPGPGLGLQPFVLQVLDGHGSVVASLDVQGREIVHARLPTAAGTTSVFRLHVKGGGQPTPNDLRTLNFRVFSVR